MSFLDQLSAKVNQGFNQVTSQTKDFTEQVKIENEISERIVLRSFFFCPAYFRKAS